MMSSSRVQKNLVLEKTSTKESCITKISQPPSMPILHDGNHCAPSILHATVTGEVFHIFLVTQFKFKDGSDGVVQSFVIVDELARSLGHDV